VIHSFEYMINVDHVENFLVGITLKTLKLLLIV